MTMLVTARFDTPDGADFALGELSRAGSEPESWDVRPLRREPVNTVLGFGNPNRLSVMPAGGIVYDEVLGAIDSRSYRPQDGESELRANVDEFALTDTVGILRNMGGYDVSVGA